MYTDKVTVPEKQKNRCVDNAIMSIEDICAKGCRTGDIKKNLTSFYDSLVRLPFCFQIPKAKKWLELMREKAGMTYNDLAGILTGKAEKKALGYIRDISVMDKNPGEDIKAAIKKTDKARCEIRKILKGFDKKTYSKLIGKAGVQVMIRLEAY